MEQLSEILKQPIVASQDLALELISYIDLTTLSEADTNESVLKLVDKANLGFEESHPAAICTYARFANFVRENLDASMQTVVVGLGFPSGTTSSQEKIEHAVEIAQSGAEELDIVLNHSDFTHLSYSQISKEIQGVKAALGTKHLKVILETGELKSAENIKKASELACEAGADFIKTSTGKTAIGATPEAVYQMCTVIAAYFEKTGRRVGIKPSGGIRTFEEAVLLHLIVQKTLGNAWLTPSLFRIGASSLYDNLIKKYKDLS
ncbi:MAG: deoxyribose-phosphate aldolase [Crocinitomix sp.]|nr:deoxyribose-phosphate aldolase [Crocinitomix sp.]